MKSRKIAICVFACYLYVFGVPDAGAQGINQRQITLLEKSKRQDDPWPRGDGHALIGEPGSPLAQKGYHEPAGSFTPSPGSFGIALWVRNEQHKLIATSDNIPMEEVEEQYVHEGNSKIPSIESKTPYYRSTWSSAGLGQWLLKINDVKPGIAIEIVFRSVGPAGGPLQSVIWDTNKLLLDRKWIATPDVLPSAITIGDESTGELLTATPGKESILSDAGWGFARLEMKKSSFSMALKDTRPQFGSTLSYEKITPQFTLELPDKRFEQSLKSQIATLMMGYIGRQTGPGEPINYPLAWERDGAYSLLAMAKSGQLQTAKELSVYFAENDFFGGFGAEGDAPGSAINALIEVAFIFNEPEFDQWLWPHIERKLHIIDEMMHAKTEIYKEFIGPLAPHIAHEIRRRQLICNPFEDGLIVGTMDNHFPVLYINALSYRALIQASRLAIKLKKPDVSSQCLAKASTLKSGWLNGFGKPKYDNERNFMISIWPSWITNKEFTPFVNKIEEQRNVLWSKGAPKERPLWTYFTVSEAHQWLFMERIDRTWETINYFWANQCAPGLFTYWEGNGEENTFRQWENYRGWLKPKYVTPHYWTASEMTHLQLDMLVYIDESKEEFEFVIGGGVPTAWLNQPIAVKNYRTKAGVVSWEYKNNTLAISIAGADRKYSARPGVAFRQNNTTVTVAYPK
jgi:hypothetical protein